MSLLSYYMAIQKKPSSGGELLFDTYGQGIAGFSLRLLKSDYTGYCIKVRRSSDDTTQDIGFVDGSLDIDSLLSFVGSGSGYVHTWYNQGSENANFVQTTNTKQPRIVNSGNIEADGNKPCMRFLGGQCLSAGNNFGNFPIQTNESYIYSIGVGSITNNYEVFYGKFDNIGGYDRRAILTYDNKDQLNMYTQVVANNIKSTRAIHSFMTYNDGINTTVTNNYYYRDGVVMNNAIGFGYTSNLNFLIGAGSLNGGGEFWYMNGICQELIVNKTNTAPPLSDIHTDINSFYGIY